MCGEVMRIALQTPDMAGKIVHCCGSEAVTRRELAMKACEVFGLDPSLLRFAQPPAAELEGKVFPHDTSLDATWTSQHPGHSAADGGRTARRLPTRTHHRGNRPHHMTPTEATDLDPLQIMRIVEECSAHSLSFFRADTSIDNKLSEGFDPVTQADREVEQLLTARLTEDFGPMPVIGEEQGSPATPRRGWRGSSTRSTAPGPSSAVNPNGARCSVCSTGAFQSGAGCTFRC